jgi:hypothetical protein
LTSLAFDKNGAIYSAPGVRFFGRVKVTPSESHRSHPSRHVVFECVRWPKAIERIHGRSPPVTVSSTHAKRYVARLRLSEIRATCTSSVADRQLICRDMYYERSFEKLRVPSVYPFTWFGSRRFRPRDRRLARTIRESLFSSKRLDALQTQLQEATKRAGVAGFSVAIMSLWCEGASTTPFCEIPQRHAI